MESRRSGPTALRIFVGTHLRRLREASGISREQAGYEIRGSHSKISRMELGRTSFKLRDVADLLDLYGADEADRSTLLLLAEQANEPGWWHDYRDVVPEWFEPYLGLERDAALIRTYEIQYVPGLLQTEDYARAVIGATEADPQRLRRYTEFRLTRQRVLTGAPAVSYHAVIHEAALHTRVGSPAIMRRQLLRLIEISRLPNVTVQVYPFEAGNYAAHTQSFVIYGAAAPELDTVYLEHPTQSLFLRDGEQLTEYAKMFERLSEMALAPVDPEAAPESHEARDSLSLIQHVMYTL